MILRALLATWTQCAYLCVCVCVCVCVVVCCAVCVLTIFVVGTRMIWCRVSTQRETSAVDASGAMVKTASAPTGTLVEASKVPGGGEAGGAKAEPQAAAPQGSQEQRGSGVAASSPARLKNAQALAERGVGFCRNAKELAEESKAAGAPRRLDSCLQGGGASAADAAGALVKGKDAEDDSSSSSARMIIWYDVDGIEVERKCKVSPTPSGSLSRSISLYITPPPPASILLPLLCLYLSPLPLPLSIFGSPSCFLNVRYRCHLVTVESCVLSVWLSICRSFLTLCGAKGRGRPPRNAVLEGNHYAIRPGLARGAGRRGSAKWDANFAMLKQYVEAHGHDHVSRFDNSDLHVWVAQQRYHLLLVRLAGRFSLYVRAICLGP